MPITYNAHCPECLGVIPVSVILKLGGVIPSSGPGLGMRVEVTDVDMSNVATHKHADPPHPSKAAALMAHGATGLDSLAPGAGAAALAGMKFGQKFAEGIAGARPPVPNATYNIHVTNNPVRRPWWKFWA